MDNTTSSQRVLLSNGRWQIDADFPAPEVPAIIKDDSGAEEPGGILPRQAIEADLEVIIPEWIGIPGATSTVVLSWRLAGAPFNTVQSFHFPDPVAPGDKTVTLARVFLVEGVHELSYKISIRGNQSPESLKKPVTVDLTPPELGQRPKAPVYPPELVGVITEDYLAAEGEVRCRVPIYVGARAKDGATFFWTALNPPPDGEPALGTVQFTQDDFDNDRLIFPVPAQVIRQSGSGTRYAYYTLEDLAGNVSPNSQLAAVEVDLVPPPQNLKPARVPLSSRGLIDRQHAREGATNEGGVTVEIDSYANADARQFIEIDWEGTALAAMPVDPNGFPLRAFVPWPVLTAAGLGPSTVAVDYQVRRGSILTPSPGPVFVPVDFTIAGQDHPNAPALLNVTLALIEVRGKNSNTANVLTSADFGLDADATLALYQAPNPGETLKIFWGALSAPVADYTVQPGDVAGQPISFVIPWAVIAQDMSNPALPVFYTTDNGVNQQQSRTTNVVVNIDVFEDLKEPSFPHVDFNGYLNCCARPRLWEGVTVRIPGDPRFSPNDRIELSWQGCDSLNGTRPIPGVSAIFTRILSASEAVNGLDIVVLPFDTLIAPMVNNGSALVQYTLYKVSGAVGRSYEEFVKITRQMPSGEVCGPDNDLCNE